MARKVVIYHNPRCGKSRQTLELLRENGVEPTIVEYLKTPPTAPQLEALIQALGGDAHVLLRTKEAAYKKRKLSKNSSIDEVCEAIIEDPILFERPIVVVGRKAAIGRPPENVLALLD